MPPLPFWITLWRDPRQIALVALTSAVYVALLIPFKIAPLVPGFTEFRPGAAVPLAFGALLGGPACVGAAMGNLVGDIVGGTFGPGSAFGVLANFFMAWTAWRLGAAFGLRPWLARRGEAGPSWHAGLWLRFLPGALLGSAACAMTLGWGIELLGGPPYAFLANVVFLNNVLVGAILGPSIAAILGPRISRWGLGPALAEPSSSPGWGRRGLGVGLVLAGSLGGYLLLNVLATGQLSLAPLAPDGPASLPGLGTSGAVALTLLVVGLLLL